MHTIQKYGGGENGEKRGEGKIREGKRGMRHLD